MNTASGLEPRENPREPGSRARATLVRDPDQIRRAISLPHFPTFGAFLSPGDAAGPLRSALYRSDGPGFVVIPGFLEAEYVAHVRQFWLNAPPSASLYARWNSSSPYPVGHPPMMQTNERRTVYCHFLWNQHFDEVTVAIALAITHIRNVIEGTPPHRHLVPDGSAVMTYRVIISRFAEEPEVREHRDLFPGDQDNLSRLQATLFLSEHGKDYHGDGFIFETNGGAKVRIGADVQVLPGDLVLWRYNNPHSIGRIESTSAGIGFVRMIFPAAKTLPPQPPADPEGVTPRASTRSTFLDRVRRAYRARYVRLRTLAVGTLRRLGLRGSGRPGL